MNRRAHRQAASAIRVPRTRGDEPYAPDRSAAGCCVPRTRGDEPRSLDADAERVAFPARAGMNRRRRQTGESTASVPRTRGDEPEQPAIVDTLLPAFPARAGMNRRSSCAEASSIGVPRIGRRGHGDLYGVPRTRGDEPYWWKVAFDAPFVVPRLSRHRTASASRRVHRQTALALGLNGGMPKWVNSPNHVGFEPQSLPTRACVQMAKGAQA